MVEEKRKNLNLSEVKTDILQFILGNGHVSETVIRSHLKEKYESIDQGTLNRYLHGLKTSGCIELIPPEKKGLRNHWDIKRSENLKNIKHNYPGIPLSKYEKSLLVIVNEFGNKVETPQGLKFYIRLLLSPSFFNECISAGIENLLSRAWKIYLYGEGFKRDWHIRKLLNEFNNLYLNGSPDFRIEEFAINRGDISLEKYLKTWDEKFPALVKEMQVENFLEIETELLTRMKDFELEYLIKSELFFEHLKEAIPELPTEKITYIDSILKAIEEVYFKRSKFSVDAHGKMIEEWLYGLFRGVSPQVSHSIERELILRETSIPEEIHREKLYQIICKEKFPIWAKEKSIPVETIRELMKKDLEIYKKLAAIYSEMKLQQNNFEHSRFDLVLEHYFAHDLLNGCATDDEIEFVKTIKDNFERVCDLNKSGDDEEGCRLFLYGDLEKESEMIVKYKQPAVFYRPTSKEVYEVLKKNIWTKRD